MSLPNLSGTGRLTHPPELRYSSSGTAILSVSLAFNSRRKDQATGEWVDGDTFFVRGTAFKQLAESAVETLDKGMEVVVSGRLKTDQWEDRQSGEKRTAPSLLIDSIGPNLAYATAKVNKISRNSGGFGERRPTGTDGIQTNGDEADPWGSAPPAGQPFDDVPPF